jgi:hypothetical protein
MKWLESDSTKHKKSNTQQQSAYRQIQIAENTSEIMI